ncbi:phage tail assembly chaperone [uncultured Brevundimonas sp.]
MDAPLSPDVRQAWATYRQALRDITQTFATPDEVTWPQPPSA